MNAAQFRWPTIRLAPYLCPDLLATLAVCTVICALCVWRASHNDNRARGERAILGRARALWLAIATRPEALLSWMVLGGVIWATSQTLFSVRYLTLAIPFLFVLVGLSLFSANRRRGLPACVLLALVGFNVANRNGAYFPSLASGPVAEHVSVDKNYERSHEYLAFHRSNIAAIHLLERRHHDEWIVATYPFAHFLGLPRLGYVKTPLGGFCTGTGSSVRTFQEIGHWRCSVPCEPILMSDRFSPLAPVEPGDEVIYDDHRSPPLIVCRKRWKETPPARKDSLERWYQDRSWPGKSFADKVINRCTLLVRAGRTPRAIGEYRTAMAHGPASPGLGLQLAHLLKDQGDLEAAAHQVIQYLDAAPDDFEAHTQLVRIRLEQGQPAKAIGQLRQFAARNPNSKQAPRALADLYLLAGRYTEAKEPLQSLLKLDPQDGDAWFHLGYVYLVERNQQKAVDSLSEALKHPLSPENAEKAKQYLTRIHQGS